MDDLNSSLPEEPVHFSHIEIARLLHTRYRGFGRKYKTELEAVQKVSENDLQVGLLNLILDKLESLHERPVERELEQHKDFLLYWHEYLMKLNAEHDRELRRISEFCDMELLDVSFDTRTLNLSSMSVQYRSNRRWFDESVDDLKKSIQVLKSVRSLSNLENLFGIGKKTADRIRKEMRSRQAKM